MEADCLYSVLRELRLDYVCMHSVLAFPSSFYHHLSRQDWTPCESNPTVESDSSRQRPLICYLRQNYYAWGLTRWAVSSFVPISHSALWSKSWQTLKSRTQTRQINRRAHSSSFKVLSLSISIRLWLTDGGWNRENETGDYEQRIIVLDPVPSSDPNQPLVSDMVDSRVEVLHLSQYRTGALRAKPSTSLLSWPPRH